MLQDIEPHIFDNGYSLREPAAGDCIVALQDGEVLLAGGGASPALPEWRQVAESVAAAACDPLYLFAVDGRGFFFLPGSPDAPEGLRYRPQSDMRAIAPDWMRFAVATALHLAQWYEARRFCGRCGTPMARSRIERALVCPECGLIEYPRISPAVIAGIVDGDRLLLTRYANAQPAHHALVAGYVEIGETLETAVRREVREEVGLEIRNLRYFGSQPWAFSGSLLSGFFADVDGSTDISLNNDGVDELADARWFARGDIPANDNPSALTALMIETFRASGAPQPA